MPELRAQTPSAKRTCSQVGRLRVTELLKGTRSSCSKEVNHVAEARLCEQLPLSPKVLPKHVLILIDIINAIGVSHME